MNKLLCSVLFICWSGSVWSQNHLIDSLKNELDQARTAESMIALTIDIAAQVRLFNVDSARFLCEQARQHIAGVEDPVTKVEAIRKIGNAFYRLKEADTAIVLLTQAKSLATEINYQEGEAHLLNNLASVYRLKKEIDKSISYYKNALVHYEVLEDRDGQQGTLNNLASLYSEDKKDLDSAILYYHQAIDLQDTAIVTLNQAAVIFNLGLTYKKKRNFPQAILYTERALKLFRKLENTEWENNALLTLAILYTDQRDLGKALSIYQESLKSWETQGNQYKVSYILISIANLYSRFEDHAKAKTYLDQALPLVKESGDARRLATLYNSMGQNLTSLGRHDSALVLYFQSLELRRQEVENNQLLPMVKIGMALEKLNRLDSAYQYLDQSLILARKHKSINIQTLALMGLAQVYNKRDQTDKALTTLLEAYALSPLDQFDKEKLIITEELYHLYKQRNKPQLALQYFEQFKQLQDSLFSIDNSNQLVLLEAEYQFEKEKEKLVLSRQEELEQEHDFQRNILIALGVSIIFILMLAWFYRAKQIANRKTLQQKAIIEHKNEQLNISQAKLQELDHAKSRLYTNITHEFRTPLTVILGMANQLTEASQSLTMKEGERKELETGFQLIQRNGKNLLRLINQLLDLSKLENHSLRFHWIQGDIVPYLHYLTESFQTFANTHNLSLRFFSSIEKLEMDHDPEQLKQIMSNLISNAVKFTPSGGDITVRLAKQDNHLAIEVKDTGKGIAEDELPRIFDRFYQVDDPTNHYGTGIGLAHTHELVKQMGGSISVESIQGKGSIFKVTLPIRKEAPLRSATKPLEPSEVFLPTLSTAPNHQNNVNHQASVDLPHLLIIEDNADVVTYLNSCLKGLYKVEVAFNGSIGISKALETIPDIIISDVMMPEKDGYEVCEVLKHDERTSHIPIILLTAKADAASRLKGLRTGADAYLSKPFDKEELFVRLEKLAELRQSLKAHFSNWQITTESASPLEEKAAVAQKSVLDIEHIFLQKVKEIVERELNNPGFGPADLSQPLGLSVSQLYRKMNALTGTTPALFIRKIRLQRGAELLCATDLNVSEIAYEVGFSDPAYFSRTFSKEFGSPPNAHRTQK